MRYTRQAGLIDQGRLKRSKVAVFGLGGLGNPAAMYLAAAGVGELILIDRDTVEESNLNRQVLFKPEDVGKKKTDVVEGWIKKFNPEIKVKKFERICREAVEESDVVLDALDNWESRKSLWELAFRLGKTVVHGAADEWYGQVAVLVSREDAEQVKGRGKGDRIIGATAGLIGSEMALETIRVLNDPPKRSYFLSFDGKEIRRYVIKRPPWNCIIAKPDEIWLKSTVTRKKMVGVLLSDLHRKIEGHIIVKGPVLLIEPYSKRNLQACLKTPGIKIVSPAIKTDLDGIEAAVLKVDVGRSFRITAKRVWKGYEKDSMQIQRELGALVASRTGAGVDLKNHETEIFVEIHREFALVYSQRMKGIGGLPYGIEGKALLLFSGGIDSPVAAFMLAKRGVAVDFLFVNPYGQKLENRIYEVYERVRELVPGKLYVVDAGDAVEEIRSKVREGLRQVVLKRMLYRIASAVEGYEAIATGESIGQASSQTLRNLKVISGAASKPVLRPLIGMDKDETVQIARKIGTFEASSKTAEFCSLEKHSNAAASLQDILEEEAKLHIDIEEIVRTIREARKERINVDLKGAIVVRLWEGKPRLEKGKKYVFVCERGYSAEREAIKARRMGIQAYSLSRKEAEKLGVI